MVVHLNRGTTEKTQILKILCLKKQVYQQKQHIFNVLCEKSFRKEVHQQYHIGGQLD